MRSRYGWRLALGIGLGLLLLYLFLRGVAWDELAAAFRSAHKGYLAAVVAVTVVTYMARAWRWGYLLEPLAHVRFMRLFSATVVGFMTGLIVPRAGEVVRPYLVARRHAIRTSAAFATIILERLIDLITVLVLFGLYLYVLPAPETQTRGPLMHVLKVAGGLAGLAALGVLGLLFAFHVHAERAVAFLDLFIGILPVRLGQPLSRAVRSFGEGLAVLQAPAARLLMIAAQSVLMWLSIAGGIFFNNLAFGFGLPFHATFLIIGFLTVGVAVPTPGMVGGFHESYLLALTQAFGIDKGAAAAAGIALHALTNLPVLLMGLLWLGGEGLTLGKVAEMAGDESGEGPKDSDGARASQ